MFQSSLEAATLVLLLQTLRDVLLETNSDSSIRTLVREYLLHLSRVPRFGTTIMLLSKDEREMVREIWGLLLKDLGSDDDAHDSKAWGVS